MDKHKLTKEEIKGPDRFLRISQVSVRFFNDHKVPLLSVVFAFFFIGIAWTGVNYYFEQKELKAQKAYFLIEKDYEQFLSDWEKNKDKDKDKDENIIKNKEQADQLAHRFSSFFNENKNTLASVMATLSLADLYERLENVDQAIEALEKVKNVSKSTVINSLALNQLGRLFAHKKDCNQSIEIWKKILDRKEQEFLHGDVQLKIGLCYEQLQDLEKAKEYYTKVKIGKANSSASQIAKKYLRYLDLQDSHE